MADRNNVIKDGAPTNKKFQYIYGPVPSWRLGHSLGVDLLSQKDKICSFDCLYCQLGKTRVLTATRKRYVSEKDILKEVRSLPPISVDYITFSGRGEPTLATNLGQTMAALKAIRPEPIAVITNSSLMNQQDVREALSGADFVICKLDAWSQESFELINQPFKGIQFETILEGIKAFKKHFRGKLALQIMVLKENIDYAKEISELTKKILPDEIQLNTPLRPCRVEPLGREELLKIKGLFTGPKVVSVYGSKKSFIHSISDEDTLRRRGKIEDKQYYSKGG
jgi:wyosine [tRNA(Phe)-imidazoG37] synthetase (radical SAM superfamily)